MLKRFFLQSLMLLFCFVSVSSISLANELSFANIRTENSALLGKIQYRYIFWKVYNASLYSTSKPFSWQKPFYLKLHYLRDFSAKDIIDNTFEQIAKQKRSIAPAKLKSFRSQLQDIFPDIKKNDRLIGYFDGQKETTFFNGAGKNLGHIDSALFAKAFFSIWLGDHSQNKKLSKKLRGL